MFRGTFESKDPAGKVSLPFDFTDDLGDETIESTAVSIALDAGTEDDPPTNTLATSGAATVSGGLVYVPVQLGYHFCDYVVRVLATTSAGRVLPLAGLLPVRAA